MSGSVVDSSLLLLLVRKYNMELLANPIDRRKLWIKIAEEYNGAKGTKLSSQSLSKKLANIKQRQRQKDIFEKKKTDASRDCESGMQISTDGGENDLESQKDVDHTNDAMIVSLDDSDASNFQVIHISSEETEALPSARLLNALSVKMEHENEDAEETCTRHGYENILRDLLICLAQKYQIEEPCGSSQMKHELWRKLTNEYLQLTCGLVSVSQREVMRKWTNMKFTCKTKGHPHPLIRAQTLNLHEVIKKLETCQRFVLGDDALKPTETLKRLDAIRERAKAKVIVQQAQKDEKPPKKSLERQIMSETLRYEQERLAVLKERGRLQHERLHREILLADLELEKARLQLDLDYGRSPNLN